MKTNIKNIFLASTIASTLGFSGIGFAGAVPSPVEASIINQLKALNTNVKVVGNTVQSAAEANIRSRSGNDGDTIDLAPTASIHQAILSGNSQTTANSQTNTENDIISQLQPMSDNVLETATGMTDNKAISKRLVNDINKQTNLTLNLPASDSVYSNDPSVDVLSSLYSSQLPASGFSKPTAKNQHDNYFNFASLIQPTAYTPNTNASQAANGFVTFLTAGYRNPAEAIDYKTFQSKLADAQNAKDKASLYLQLMHDDKFQNYQLAARTSTAQRSVAVNNFQHLIAERTVVKGLGKQAGLTDSKGNPVNDASPLQVQKYMATRRVNNPSWFAKIQTASPAVVQRETLVVLAEIEAQNFQAHMDRERMLATLSAQAAISGSLSANAAASQASQVNQDIKNFTIPSQENNQ